MQFIQRNIFLKHVISLRVKYIVMQFVFVVMLPLLFIAGCSSEEEKIPQEVIPRDKMIAILIDVQIAEARIQSNNLNTNDSTKQIALGYYNYIFQKHHIKSSEFKSSFKYYAERLEMLNKMYEEVITGLSKRQSESAAKNRE